MRNHPDTFQRIAAAITGMKRTQKTKDKLRESKRGWVPPKSMMDRSIEVNSMIVYQYTKMGEFIKEWNSAAEIANMYNYSASAIGNCCRGFSNSSYGYIWKYKDVSNKIHKKKKDSYISIECVYCNKQVKKDPDEVKKAREKGYQLYCNRKCSSSARKSKPDPRGKDNRGCKKVIQYNMSGEFIQIYNSIRETHQLKSETTGISECCKGKNKVARGYIWRYYKENYPLTIDVSDINSRHLRHKAKQIT